MNSILDTSVDAALFNQWYFHKRSQLIGVGNRWGIEEGDASTSDRPLALQEPGQFLDWNHHILVGCFLRLFVSCNMKQVHNRKKDST